MWLMCDRWASHPIPRTILSFTLELILYQWLQCLRKVIQVGLEKSSHADSIQKSELGILESVIQCAFFAHLPRVSGLIYGPYFAESVTG